MPPADAKRFNVQQTKQQHRGCDEQRT